MSERPRPLTFRALACDYDGTLASHDRIGGEGVAALEQARAAGLRLILVTGRTFFELLRVCEPIDLFDVVVAENGGVLYFPGGGVVLDQALPPPTRLRAALDARGIPYQAGRVIVGTARTDEGRVREVLTALGIRMDLVPNRAALMLLPPGISKGTGVRQAIRALDLAAHDVLALGDAENDLAFFDACGFAACPADAVEEIRVRADWVLPGDDGAAVARGIAGPILNGGLAIARSPRHRLPIGWVRETEERAVIPARGVNVLVVGDPYSGKSWLAGVIVEQLIDRRYAVCVIDPEGDYHVLAPLPGVSSMDVRDADDVERALERFDLDPGACVVLDLSGRGHARRLDLVHAALRAIRRRRHRHGRPHWVLLDEAHYLLHREGIPSAAAGAEDKGFCLVTYRPSWLDPGVAATMDVLLLARTTGPGELETLGAALGGRWAGDPELARVAAGLPQGEFLLVDLDGVAMPRATTFMATPRMTSHVRHLGKYADGRLAPERCFLFRSADGAPAGTAASLREFFEHVKKVDPAVLSFHARRGDFSRWVLDVFGDRSLGGQLGKVERRWSRDEIDDLREALGRLLGSVVERPRPEGPGAE